MAQLDRDSFAHELRDCFDVSRWVDRMLDGAPYTSAADMRVAAEAAVRELPPAEVHEFLDGVRGGGSWLDARTEAARLAEQELDEAGANDRDELKAFAEGTATYEERFGRMFVIDDDHRLPDDLIEELQRRLLLDDESEILEARDELASVIGERVETRFQSTAH